jgi:dipeptidyl-peptidase-4
MKPLKRLLASRIAFCILLGRAVAGLAAEPSTNSPWLTLDRIFSENEFNAKGAEAFQWSKHGPGYYTLDKATNGESGRDLVLNDPATGAKEVIVPGRQFIPPGETSPLGVTSYAFSGDESKLLIYTNDKKVWRQRSRGDYWVLDIAGRVLKKLGGDAPPSSLMFAAFSPDGRRVAYVRENDLYTQEISSLRVVRLTFDGSDLVYNGRFDWVYEEELFLHSGFRWSPDSQSIAYWRTDATGVPEFHLVDDTDALYPRVTSFPYPKTGEMNSAVRAGVVGAEGGPTVWLKIPGDERDNYIVQMGWVKNQILVQQFNRTQNTNRVMLADGKSGEAKALLTETDAAWVENVNKPWWTADEKSFVWLSERDGWQHAYLVSRSNGDASLITKGEFDVESVAALDETNRCLYFIASPENPTQRYLYRAPWDGGKPRRVTPGDEPGTHSYDISPDAKWAFHTRSSFGQPPVVDLITLPDHKRVRLVEDNADLEKKLGKLKMPSSEFFRAGIEGGLALDGWRLRPPGFDPAKKYPVLFQVYGEPAGQTVLDRWGGNGYLWHAMLAQQGYLVMSVDNQGTPAPRGRAWRKAVYGRIGLLPSAQQAGAVRAVLRDFPAADPGRVAIWGWSGGGSMSLNAIFRYPDIYQTAMAVASVPNCRLYDTIYQERYLGLPADNSEAYRKASPITYAGRLKGNLLLVHGTGDDNVHYQGAEALVNELVALNKPFTMMAYPNRTHSISEGRNTTRHLYGLLTQFLYDHTPRNPPAGPDDRETPRR